MSQLIELLSQKEGPDKYDAWYKYLKRQAWEKGIPIMGLFELTPRCTLDCKMCYVHLKEDQMKQDELTTEEWISLIDQACDAGMMFATLTGGECFLHPGFKEIYEYLQSRGIIVSILSNGTLLDEETVKWLAANPPQYIQISVYGSSPEGYRNVTGSGNAFYKVNKAIDLIKAYNITFTLAITLSKQLYGDFEAVYKYCISKEPLRCDVATMPFKSRPETERKYINYVPTLDEEVEVFKIRLKVDGKDVNPYNCENELLHDIQQRKINNNYNNNIGIKCTAGRCGFSITWEGRMVPCNSFNFVEALPLHDGFIKSWDYINHRATKYKMPAECLNCIYKRICPNCPAIHWSVVGEEKLNNRICIEVKRLALEGIIKII